MATDTATSVNARRIVDLTPQQVGSLPVVSTRANRCRTT